MNQIKMSGRILNSIRAVNSERYLVLHLVYKRGRIQKGSKIIFHFSRQLKFIYTHEALLMIPVKILKLNFSIN